MQNFQSLTNEVLISLLSIFDDHCLALLTEVIAAYQLTMESLERERERGNAWQLHTRQTRHRWTNCTFIPSPCSLPPLPVGPPFQACVGWRFPAVVSKVLPLEPGVGLNIAMHALPTARNFFLLVLFSIVLVHSPSFFLLQWGTADAEIMVPSDLTNVLTLKACSRSKYSRTCFSYCQEHLPCPNFYHPGAFNIFFSKYSPYSLTVL